MIKRINSIKVINVKGVSSHELKFDIYPNRPTLLVAPNGFGKSSFATAFASLKPGKLELNKEDLHKGLDPATHPSRMILSYTTDANIIEHREADLTKNEIKDDFDTFVVKSQIISSATKRKLGGAVIATSSIDVKTIALIDRIPEAIKFGYKYTDAKSEFGANGKVLPNISYLLADKKLMISIHDRVDFSKIEQVGISRQISDFKTFINKQSGTVVDIASSIPTSLLANIESLPHIGMTISALSDNSRALGTRLDNICAAMQIAAVYRHDKLTFRKVITSYLYQLERDSLIQDFSVLRSTWKQIKPVEDKKKGLIVQFPPANQISNGERDVICFVSQLMRAKSKLKKPCCILVIDEIFDYLDDANMVACQYYLSQMAADLKSEGRQLYTLIMTHLSPTYFKGFVFNKMAVCYLNRSTGAVERSVEKIIINRDQPAIQNDLAKHFLHFHPGCKDISSEFVGIGLPATLAKSTDFKTHVNDNLAKYLSDQSFDPIAVCCAVRISIEEKAYQALAPADQPTFLAQKKTPSKLDFAASVGFEAPESWYMLGIIYNSALHMKDGSDNFSPLMSKLENLTIKNMIRAACG